MAAKNKAAVSPFDALRIARLSKVEEPVQTSEQPDSQTSSQPGVPVLLPEIPAAGLAKSRDPEYVKFTTYIPRSMHLRVKSRLVGEGRELSDLVAELLAGWLNR